VVSGEDKLIARFFKPLATHPGALALNDDAAILEPPAGHELVLTTDALVGGVHFFADDPADAIARKALRMNLSDLAAKGAKPLGFLMTLALPPEMTNDAWLQKFSDGLWTDAKEFNFPLFGGDTTRTPGPVTISIFAFGSVPQGRMIKRSGAKPGDRILVTGTIGDAALGLEVRKQPDLAQSWKLDPASSNHLTARYLLPQPRMRLAEALQAHASAAMDVSDGLAGDLGRLCHISGVSAEVSASAVPLSPAAHKALASTPRLMEIILSGGDDYEIIFTMKPDDVPTFRARAAMADVTVTDIGIVVAGQDEPRFLDAAGSTISLSRKSFSHF
jgi:thiamine-monophosphate kinase